MKRLLLLLICSGIFISCKKTNSCYSESLYQANKNAVCTQDCPGVVGCDGKTYCNACVASQQGISVP
jgi:hypothetical protein